MIVVVNGTERKLPAGATVAGLVATLADGRNGRGLAVAVGGEVVPRAAWPDTKLVEGARVELVSAVQGG